MGDSGIRILVVEDSELWQDQLTQILAEHPNLVIVGTTTKGEEAILKARDVQPDIIILDLNLPGINGFETAKLIREDFQNVKIIFFSVEHNPATIRAVLSLKGSAYVQKTRAWTELAEAVKAVLS